MIEIRHTSNIEAGTDRQLAAAAFGGEPGSWPLPSATTPWQLWLRAVAAGGQGRYGNAYRDLADLRHSSGRLVSLSDSTYASFLRQLGWHTLARRWDGRALALAGADPEARGDALIGLAADALGVGRCAAAATLLSRADHEMTLGAVPNRLAVRRRWVGAELAMVSGDGRSAVRHAADAVELAAGTTSARHRAKSEVVLAAALCSAGHTDRARAVAEAALDATGRLGLIPLRWASACLLIDTGSITFSPTEMLGIRDVCAGQVRRAGGVWRTA